MGVPLLFPSQVQGYRVRLHFDGYPECYDFWLNADSWDMKPAGWCEKNGHKLLLPKGEGEVSGGQGPGSAGVRVIGQQGSGSWVSGGQSHGFCGLGLYEDILHIFS